MPIPWLDESPLWNIVFLGGVALPGISKVDIEDEEKLDVQEPKGASGAAITDNGRAPRKVVITTTMWLAEHLEAWSDAYQKLRGSPGKAATKTATAHDFTHPKGSIYGIRSLVIKSIKDDAGDRGDKYVVKIDCVEWFPPPKNQGSSKPIERGNAIQQNAAEAAAKAKANAPSKKGAGPGG